jgi:hypothetical protein
MAQIKTPQEIEDFLVVEELDLGDESELRRVVAEVEALVDAPGRGLRVSVLTAEQWKTVIVRFLSPSLRRGAERYVHALRDPGDPRHLLVSPSAVRGINEGARTMYQEVVFALLRALPSEVAGPLRRGLDDIIAEACAERIGVELFARNYPRESDVVRCLLDLLVSEFGYSESEWALELRRNSKRVLMALRKTPLFAPLWTQGREAGLFAAKEPKRALEEIFSDRLRGRQAEQLFELIIDLHGQYQRGDL